MTAGRDLQAMRKERAVVCAECGEGFTAKDPRARFCSNRCQQAAKYRKVKAEAARSANPPTDQPTEGDQMRTISNRKISESAMQRMSETHSANRVERRADLLRRLREKMTEDPDGIWAELYAELTET